ncbi:MAG: ABC transporter substrate-binding protein [Candidatus Dojkabacteria bacterium]|nr:MAG: ABC transporter substrate-binding protein [Candidatus Dojkabacteria bacterium]
MSLSAYNFREWVWGYPDGFARFFSATRPVGYIVVSLALAVATFGYLARLQPSGLLAIDNGSSTLYREAAVGQVVTLNPIYINQNQIDRDIHQLVYEKLLYIAPNGEAQPAIAESWEFEEDGKQLRIKISDKYYWHDGEKVTVDDVLFTIQKAMELSGSSRFDTFGNALVGVTVSKVDDRTMIVTLDTYSSTLLETLSFYVVPKHLLEGLDEEEFFTYGLRVPPVGSGMYSIIELHPDRIDLRLNTQFPFDGKKPSIETIEYSLFDTAEDIQVVYMNRQVDGINGLEEGQYQFVNEYKPSIYSMQLKNHKKLLYFNMNKEKTKQLELRKAISYSIDKDRLLEQAGIKGSASFSPVMSDSWALNSKDVYYKFNLESAVKSIEAAGYTKAEGEEYYKDKDGNIMTLTITYHDEPKNNELIKELAEMLKEVGIQLDTRAVDYGRLVNEVLATRDFEMLLLEVETNIDPDQYNLWHSTKKQYPDLNVSGYEYSRVDVLLERARVSQDREARTTDYQLFQKYLSQDVPAIVLFEPEYHIIMNDYVKNVSLEGFIYPHERFRDIQNWEIDR